MTFRFGLWVAALTATILVSQIQERLFSPYLVLFILLLGPISLLWDGLWHKLAVELIPQDEMVQRGEPAGWQLRLINRDRGRTHFLDYWRGGHGQLSQKRQLHLPPKSNETIELVVDTRHCGVAEPPSFRLRYLSLFGLFRLPLARDINRRFQPIYVLPAVQSALDQPGAMGDLIKLGQMQSSGREANHDEVDYMRTMVAGDPMRLIHWKLSARLQDWMVRQFAKAQEKSVHVLVELPELSSADKEAGLTYRDELLERVATEIRGFLWHDFQVTLVTHQPQVVVQTVTGLDRFDSLRRQLAVAAPLESVPLVVQLAGDLGERGSYVFYLATTELNRESTREISQLRRVSGGVFLEILRSQLDETTKQLIRELQADGVEVIVTKRRSQS